MLPKIIVTPFGGHATSLFLKRWRRQIHPRPDYIFSEAIDTYDIHSYANWDETFRHVTSAGGQSIPRDRSWQKRTGFDPQADKTIHEHLMELINNTPNPILLFGKCSLSETWLTNNKITDAIFIQPRQATSLASSNEHASGRHHRALRGHVPGRS